VYCYCCCCRHLSCLIALLSMPAAYNNSVQWFLAIFKKRVTRLAMPYKCLYLVSARTCIAAAFPQTRAASSSYAGVQFDLESFKMQLSRLAMPHQAFTYSTLTLDLLDDPALAAAFAVSLRTSFMQVPHAASDPVGELARVSVTCYLHCYM
jgi:hypothetical protein